MFISGGENVYPAEVETVLFEHASVRDAAVVGVPDETWGEVGAAYVVAEPPVSEDELIAFCRERLAGYKYPRRVTVVDEMPRSATGKILKGKLR
jgi:fatty-acyl-CoA synthase